MHFFEELQWHKVMINQPRYETLLLYSTPLISILTHPRFAINVDHVLINDHDPAKAAELVVILDDQTHKKPWVPYGNFSHTAFWPTAGPCCRLCAEMHYVAIDMRSKEYEEWHMRTKLVFLDDPDVR